MTQDFTGTEDDHGCECLAEPTLFTPHYRVLLRTESKSAVKCPPEGNTAVLRGRIEFKPDKVLLRATDFCSAFPYHIIFDWELKIRQCGDLVQKHCNVAIREGMHLTKAFNIVHPKMVVSIENIRKFINAVFLIAISPNENGKKTFLLKGQMIWLCDTQNMIFIGSPRLTSLNELIEMNVYLADIPLYDVTRELVLLNQQRIAEIDIAKKLDETTAELKRTSQALEEEKSKTETLLHQMLPRKVATALTHGQKVEAEKFDQVTILFSDIVTFTNIASACSPMDIVNMLNEMYQRFDERTSQHNVYKVETIGDAYMIVSGVPEKTTNHAQPVANFALDMVEDAGLVRSPATGLPLQIRVGVHTGPVVAGVVGVKMPRYCLFGDTVNTASRMESHGAPGRIHLSSTVYQALRGSGYTFKQRGQMEVKGKGMMSTYFLCGHLARALTEPQDEFTGLELYVNSVENYTAGKLSELTHDSSCNTTKMLNEDHLVLGDDPAHTSKEYVSNRSIQHSWHSVDETKQEMNNQPPGFLPRGSLCSLKSLDLSSHIARKQSNSSLFQDSFQHSQNVQLHRNSSNYSNDNTRKTALNIASDNSHTTLTTSNSVTDCVYISGSFNNDYCKSNSFGNNHDPQFLPQNSGKLNVHKVCVNNKVDDSETEISTSINPSEDTTKNLHCSTTDKYNTVCTPTDLQPISGEGKPTALNLTISSSATPLPCNILSKSETFPLPSFYNSRPASGQCSGSQGNLMSFKTGGRSKRGKKHKSKLCLVA